MPWKAEYITVLLTLNALSNLWWSIFKFPLPLPLPLTPLEYDKFFRSGRKDKERSTGVRGSTVQLSFCQPHSLHPFPSDDKNTLGEMAKRRGSTNKNKTFSLNCFNYCTHDKLQEWPPLPLPQKKVNFFEREGFSRGYWRKNYPPPQKNMFKMEECYGLISVKCLESSIPWSNQVMTEKENYLW